MSLDLFSLEGREALITGGAQGLGPVMAKARSEWLPDVTDTAQVNAMVQTVIDECGRIDILINNAGINISKPMEEFEDEQWDRVQNTYLKAPFLCARAVAKQMKQQQ